MAKRIADAKKNKVATPDIKARLKKAIHGEKPKPVINDATLAKVTPEALQKVHQFQQIQIRPILTEVDYAQADIAFGKIVEYEKWWDLQMEGTDSKPGPLKLARMTKQALDDLNRTMTNPTTVVKNQLKAEMTKYKLEEIRIRAAENLKLEQEKAALLAQAQVKRIAPPQIKAILQKVEELEEVQQVIQEVRGVDAAHSHSRERKTWEVIDPYALCKAIMAGIVPADVLELKVATRVLNQYWKDDPETVAEWPGVRIIDEVTIASGGRWQE